MIKPLQVLVEYVVGTRESKPIPKRVQDSIDKEARRGEEMICFLQLGLMLFILSLWSVSHKPTDITVSFDYHPVPIFSLSYATLALARLWLIRSGRANDTVISLSIIIDFVLVVGLLIFYQFQYNQPPDFVLKLPSATYFYVMIALRALSFSPRHVVFTGMLALMSWIFLTARAVITHPSDNPITKSLVEGVYNQQVLFGMEGMRGFSLLSVMLATWLALHRSRELLRRAVVEEAQAAELSRFLAPEIAEVITQSENSMEPGVALQREMTVMFTDLKGFSTLAEKITPAELIAALNEYFSVIAPVIVAEKGVVNQFRGDAMIVTFNAPTDLEDHAAAALRAAWSIHQINRDHVFGSYGKLLTRVGIHTGMVAVGTIGAGQRLDFTLHGDDVNLAARLEPLNKEFGTDVLFSQATLDHAGDIFPVKEVSTQTVRGRVTPVTIYTFDATTERRYH